MTFKANPNNELGLYTYDSKVYSVLGFFHDSSKAESDHKYIEGLPSYPEQIHHYDFKNEFDHWQPISYDKQLFSLGLNPKDHIVFRAYANVTFVFSRYKEQIGFSQQKNIRRNYKDALLDYVCIHGHIKLIATPHRIIRDFKNFEIHKKTDFAYTIDKKRLIRTFDPIYYKTSYGMDTDKLNPNMDIKDESLDKKLSPQDHYNNKEKAISTKVIENAHLKGGFIELDYKGNKYNIPLLPLLAWSKNWKEKSFDFGFWTWFFENNIQTELILGSQLEKEYNKDIPKDLEESLRTIALSIKEEDFEDFDE